MSSDFLVTFMVFSACSTDSDLVVIFDASTSIGSESFQDMKLFLEDIITDINVAEDKTHVGAVVFSDDADVVFRLDEGMESRTAVMDLINGIEYR